VPRFAPGYDVGVSLLNRLWRRLRSLFIPSVAVASVLRTRVVRSQDKRNEAVQQLYTWERDRLLTLAKGLAAAAVTVVTGLIAAALEGKVTAPGYVVYLAALLVAELLSWSGFIVTGLRRLAEEYPVALGLVN
jgi:hypothetical protein